jgi:rhamnosyltransferase subunit B
MSRATTMSDSHPPYVVITVGTTGDVHPFMRMAKALQGMGRRVTFISNSVHAGLLRGAGLDFVGLGTDEAYLRFLQNPDVWDERKGFGALLADYGAQLLEIDAAIRSSVGTQQAVAICHPFAVPGAAMARERGRVHAVVAAHMAPSTMRTCHDPMRIGSTVVPRWAPMGWRRALWRFVEKGWIDPVGIAQLNQARDALKLPRVTSTLLTHIEAAPDLTLTLFPSWFGPAMPDWPQPRLSADFPLFDAVSQDGLSTELKIFLASGEMPIVFTPGTGNLHAQAFFSTALAAATDLGRRAIFLTRERAQVPAGLPPSVMWQPYVPLSALLPHVAVLVHHGGIGTTAEALRAGTPQLVAPFAWDQFDNGARVAALGAGLVLPARKLRERPLTRALQALLTSGHVRTSCEAVASRFTVPLDPDGLCAEIERRVAVTRTARAA